MDRVMTPQEWACKGEKPPTDVLLNSESVLEYAKYYHSKQPKNDIILPEPDKIFQMLSDKIEKSEGREGRIRAAYEYGGWLYENGLSDMIDEVKRLNGIQ